MNSLDKQYQDLLQTILDYGVIKGDRTGTGTQSIFGYTIRHNMRDGFPLLTTKKMHYKSIISELLWFMQGRTDLRWLLEHDNTIWVGDAYKAYQQKAPHDIKVDNEENTYRQLTKEEFIEKVKTDDEFAKKWGQLGPIYGKQWRKWTKTTLKRSKEDIPMGYQVEFVDQLQNSINRLLTNPDCRRNMVTAWQPAEIETMTLPPCHYGFQFYTRELTFEERCEYAMKEGWMTPFGALDFPETHYALDSTNTPTRAISLLWNQRSVDTPLGLPFNIASYALLLEIVGKIVNMVPDQLIGNLGDTHIYLNQIEGVKEQISREPFPLPKLRINTEFWPTQSGECGIGPLVTDIDVLLQNIQIEDFQIEGYQSHPTIKFPLSN
jgi:thymidylate synthase